MIKVMNLVGLIMAPIVVGYSGYSLGIITAILIGGAAIVGEVRRAPRLRRGDSRGSGREIPEDWRVLPALAIMPGGTESAV